MSDCSPLELAENGHSSSPSQSLASHESGSRQPLGQPQAGARARAKRREPPAQSNSNINEQGDNNVIRIRSNSESSSKSSQIRYGAKNVIELFVPVSICMLLVVTIMKLTDSYHYSSQSVIWYAQMMYTDQTVDTGTRVWQSFANALIMLVMIIVMTTVLILLYKFRCYTTIHGWLIVSSLMLLFLFATVHITELLKVYNVAMDIYTMGIFLWNFGVVGMVCIHWKGPLLVQQGYLILISAFMALIFIQCLPDWTIWTVLAIVSIWDLVAVLAPRGPLRILVETAQERNESIFPALIYSSTIMWEVLGTTVASTVPTLSMADATPSRRSESSSKSSSKSRHSESGSGRNQAGAKRNPKHSTITPSSPKKREHPVEIHYEDGAQPPEVAFIQPSLNTSSDQDDWQRSTVKATDARQQSSQQRRRVTRPSRIGEEEDEEAAAAEREELAINLPSNNNRDHHHHHNQHSNNTRQMPDQAEEERGVKLGLGDFIFYSVLVGKASAFGDWTVTVSCYVAILVGLSVTLSLLAIFRKALPALPISIAFGMCSFFLSSVFVVPFAEELATNQVFI